MARGQDYVKTAKNKMSLILELKLEEIEDLNKYTIMFHAQPENKYSSLLSKNAISKNRKHEIWDFKPKIVTIDRRYYLIKTIETGIEDLKTINLGVYSADGYKGLLYDKIIITL